MRRRSALCVLHLCLPATFTPFPPLRSPLSRLCALCYPSFAPHSAYSARLGFYRRKIFACSSSGKTGLDYFAALASEHRESELVKSRFPNQLKPRVLAAVNFRALPSYSILSSELTFVAQRWRAGSTR